MKAYAALIKLQNAQKSFKVGVYGISKGDAIKSIKKRFPDACLANLKIVELENVKVNIKLR